MVIAVGIFLARSGKVDVEADLIFFCEDALTFHKFERVIDKEGVRPDPCLQAAFALPSHLFEEAFQFGQFTLAGYRITEFDHAITEDGTQSHSGRRSESPDP